MPKVSIYIRDEDYEKWTAIKDKPFFISEAINKLDIILRNYERNRYLRKEWHSKNKESVALRNKKNMERYMQTEAWKIKHRAYGQVSYAIRKGRIIKPTICQTCMQDGLRIEAHHDDYSKPLDIVWMCRPCHDKFHHSAYVV